jgi:nucleoside-diphosphate-sugar epimerase
MTARIIVITGAAGNIGGKLCTHLEAVGGYQLRLLDIDARGDPGIMQANLATYDEDWAKLFAGADAVVHLAANPNNGASWEELTGPNIDALLNIYLAAQRFGVRRVVFASSVWAMAGRLNDDAPIDAGEPNPGHNRYGASKAFGERVGKAFAEVCGVETVALRLGGYAPDDKQPPLLLRWEAECRISARDVCIGFELALKADVDGFAVVNLISLNPGSRWSLTETNQLIGFEPTHCDTPRPRPASNQSANPSSRETNQHRLRLFKRAWTRFQRAMRPKQE